MPIEKDSNARTTAWKSYSKNQRKQNGLVGIGYKINY